MSGGSIMGTDATAPVLLATISRNNETQEMAMKALKSGVPNKAPFDEKNWANYAIPVNGPFLEAIQTAGD